MKITIITVGKLKEKYLKIAIEEYSKRLRGIFKNDLSTSVNEGYITRTSV